MSWSPDNWPLHDTENLGKALGLESLFCLEGQQRPTVPGPRERLNSMCMDGVFLSENKCPTINLYYIPLCLELSQVLRGRQG